MKLGEGYDAANSCTEALKIDPQNVKALFRRGQAFLMANEFEKARESLLQAAKLDPQNKPIRTELEKVKEEKRKSEQESAVVYKKMILKEGVPLAPVEEKKRRQKRRNKRGKERGNERGEKRGKIN